MVISTALGRYNGLDTSAKPKLPALGETIAGRYRLDAVLGRGGMGTVFKAEHINMGKTVALKMITSASFDDSALRRFRLEAKLASQLDHPNIVGITDFDVDNGRPFLVMDFLKGKSLDRIIAKEGKLPLDRFEKIMVQACRALGYAHKNGIIHRDVKLSNMMIVERGGEKDVLVIVDFGLIKVMTDKLPGDQKQSGQNGIVDIDSLRGGKPGVEQALTQADVIVGSPLYMSPEQIRANRIDSRSDIYSLGCVMYQCLTGVTPFEGCDTNATFYKHVFEDPRPFSEIVPGSAVPPALEAVVLKALQKNPDLRQQDMQELADEITRALKKKRPLEHVDPSALSFESSLLNPKQIDNLHSNTFRNVLAIAMISLIVLSVWYIVKLLGPKLDEDAGYANKAAAHDQ